MQISSCYQPDVVSREAEQNNGDNPGSTSFCIAPVVFARLLALYFLQQSRDACQNTLVIIKATHRC